MTKELLIITLLILVIYLAYQSQFKPNLLTNSAQLTQLEQERNHYQTLYQKRVQKDLEHDQTQKIQQLTSHLQQLEHNLSQEKETKTLYQQKATDLETSLMNLAKQKIKGQKEAQQLLNQLESNWNQDKLLWKTTENHYSQKLTELTQNQQQKATKLKTYLNQQDQNISELEKTIW